MGDRNAGAGRTGDKRTRKPLTRTVRVSKALSLVLRHRAAQLGLTVRSDGFVELDKVLVAKPVASIRSLPADPETGLVGPVTVAEIRTIIRTSDKQRFALRRRTDSRTELSSSTGDNDITGSAGEEDDDCSINPSADSAPASIFLIRANQGHSMPTVETASLLRPILLPDCPAVTAEEGGNVESSHPPFPTLVVHGTTAAAWPQIVSSGGISRMGRLHVHFAAGLPSAGFDAVRRALGAPTSPALAKSGESIEVSGQTVISGMRPSSSVVAVLDLPAALRSGLRFWMSDNGVVLTEGNAEGVVPLNVIRLAVRRDGTVLFNQPDLQEQNNEQAAQT